ncbi:mannose-P-dolichol utilization defect 1 protein like protein [Ditylenchus destructor]|uniref:Mannose-P-dolichol utilization defect 1 protein like protein n=1 Tax=Ditylenchus destructor TaxID=166010 RepID=A0AAD4MU79_9BILA|nr:mannose-P-dolichol utilization defect 1 protein like protein [Ditylenchus destructor]
MMTLSSIFILMAQITQARAIKLDDGEEWSWKNLLGLISNAARAAYCYEKGIHIGFWADSIVLVCRLHYSVAKRLWNSKLRLFAPIYLVVFTCVSAAVQYHQVPIWMLCATLMFTVAIIFIMEGLEVVKDYKQHNLANAAPNLIAIQLASCLSRCWMIYRYITDFLVVMPMLSSAAIIGIVLAQKSRYENASTNKSIHNNANADETKVNKKVRKRARKEY